MSKNIKPSKIDPYTLKNIELNIPLGLQVHEIIISTGITKKSFKTNKGVDNYTKKLLSQSLSNGNIKIDLKGIDFNN